MKQEDFADIVWKQWATAPNEEIQIEELRPMREVQLTGKRGSGVKDAPWMFTAWAVAYPDDDDPWMSDSIKRDQRMMESVMGINMVLDNEELFRQKELMVDIDEAFITETTDKDGNEIIVQEMGYRSVLPFLSTFNKSAYDVIFREHQRLLKKIGESYLAKALLRFETWFKQNGIVDHNEIEPFWSSDFDADAIGAANEPDPPPLSDEHKWEDVLLEIGLLRQGRFQIRVFHPSLDIQNGVAVSMDNWQTKLRNILIMHGGELSLYLDPDVLLDKWGERWEIQFINKQDINRLRNQLKRSIGITNDKPIFDQRGGKWQFKLYTRLHKNFHHKATGRILSEDDRDLIHSYAYMQPNWLLEKLGIHS